MERNRLYYQDPYIREFDSEVIEMQEENGRYLAVLAESAFYPEGGGQPADHGVLIITGEQKNLAEFDAGSIKSESTVTVCGNSSGCNSKLSCDRIKQDKSLDDELKIDKSEINGAVDAEYFGIEKKKNQNSKIIKVTDVQEINDKVWHTISEPLPVGTKVHGRIDWKRRFDHMQQHSGEHIVSGMICRRFNCDNVGFHLGEDTVTIDYNAQITYEQICEIEQAANQYIWEDHEFVELWPTADELADIDYRSKKELNGTVRITSFPGADTCACCGTHVRRSGEVGLVKFISAKPFHDGTRLELYCGKRAMDFLAMNYDSNKEVAVLLSTKEEKTPQLVKKLIEEKLQLKSNMTALEERYLKLRADSVISQSDVLIFDDCLNSEQGRILADMISDNCQGITAVMTGTDGAYRYSIINKNADITAFVKSMNAALGGRGGGRNGFAQGSLSAGRKQIEEFFKQFESR